MLNWIFIALIGGAVLTAGFTGTMPKVTEAAMAQAKSAVELAIGLIGQMALWLGFMGILREAGLMGSLARGLKPIMRRLFPDVPAEHPAMGAMIMNVAANMLGLGNAATPFGLKAMAELNRLNPHPGIATNAMALFLAINTSGVAVLPLGAVAVRAALGSKDAAGIIVPSILATTLNTVVAVAVAKLLEKRSWFSPSREALTAVTPSATESKGPDAAALAEAEQIAAVKPPATGWRLWISVAIFVALSGSLARYFWQSPVPGLDRLREAMSSWLLPVLMLSIVVFGFARRVKVYEVFVQSAKEGFQIAITIIPFLIAILVAIGMFRASGAMEAITATLTPITAAFGFPAEALPMALIRPLSGSGALAIMTETMKTYGPDSFVGYLVSVINGTTETTFYVLAVYFGAVQVRAVRHTIWACIASDIAGIAAALAVCHLFF